jgi:outer membrane protein assembly factor BamA
LLKGYAAASLDSINKKAQIYTAFFHLGKKYTWLTIEKGNIPNAWLDKIRFQSTNFQQRVFHFEEIEQLAKQVLGVAASEGFAFATFSLENVTIENQQIKARLHLEKGQFVQFGGVELVGTARISKDFLENHLGIKKGTPFNQTVIQNLSKQLHALRFLEITQPPKIFFRENRAIIQIFADAKQQNQIEALLGIQTNERGKAQLTGTASANFANILARGEQFNVYFQRPQGETQELRLDFNYPYLLGSPFGVHGNMRQYRRDSTYSDVTLEAGVQYFLSGNNYMQFFWNTYFSTLNSIDKARIIAERKLPNILDIQQNTFGVAYSIKNIDNIINPKKGYILHIKGSAGNRILRPNNLIIALKDPFFPDFSFKKLYDTLQKDVSTYRFLSHLQGYVPISKHSTLKIALQSGGQFFSKTTAFQNEKFRIGGNALMRGFNEQSIYTDFYAVATTEYRILTGKNAFLYAFLDEGWVKFGRNHRFLTGIGIGTTLETKAGIFGISYALGKDGHNSLIFRDGKVHVGYFGKL